MAKRETIIWTSKLFPKLIMTKEHLEVLRYAYPEIKQFEPQMRLAEAWLYANEARRPKKNWKAFVNNWMRIASEKIKERAASKTPVRAEYGESSRSLKTDPRQLSTIMREIADRMPKPDNDTNQQNPRPND
jgi:hypothetical protein